MALGAPARLDASALIELADRASVLSPCRWSVALLQRAYPEAAPEALLALPVGARDRLVLAIRAGLGSGPLRAEPVCQACGETYELALEPERFGLAGAAPWPDPGYRRVPVGGGEAVVRPVNLCDILDIERIAEPETAAQVLAELVQKAAADLPLDALAEALEALDPGADVWLETVCPECGASHSTAFDPVHFVAHEMRQLARQVLRDVVDIARVFHWSEADILALPEHRRAFYVAEAVA
jgi:rubredoxin